MKTTKHSRIRSGRRKMLQLCSPLKLLVPRRSFQLLDIFLPPNLPGIHWRPKANFNHKSQLHYPGELNNYIFMINRFSILIRHAFMDRLLMDPTALPSYHVPTNYQEWSTKMREYLLKEGAWYNIIEFSSNQPSDDYKTWRGKNAMALRAIQDACAPNTPVQIVGHTTSAKIAWESLAKLITFKQRGITPTDPRYNYPLRDVNAGLKQIYEMKLTHTYAMECIGCICNEIPTTSEFSEDFLLILVAAIENGIEEVVFEILKAHPDCINLVDNQGRDLMMLAVAFRQEKIFNLMLQHKRYTMVNIKDYSYNNMLHWVGKLPPPKHLAGIPGAALQMQRELQWFQNGSKQVVQSILQPSFLLYCNSDGDTPHEAFTKTHKGLMEDGEKWMKQNATAFTIPGGNFEDGLPLFRRKKAFITFMISDAISLFSSSTSVLMFLGILTSSYTEDNFVKSLPKKLIIGLSALHCGYDGSILRHHHNHVPWKALDYHSSLFACCCSYFRVRDIAISTIGLHIQFH
ncbi:hypothetical protein Tsubulata_007488, partial [Turnera subulata]